METEKLVYTAEEVGKLLGLSTNSVYRACKTGEIPSLRVGNRLIIPKFQLNLFLRSGGNNEKI